MSVWGEHRKAIYLFQVAPCSPCGTILFRTKPIWSKRMRRLVIACVFYILGGTGLNNVCAFARFHGSRCRQRPGHH